MIKILNIIIPILLLGSVKLFAQTEELLEEKQYRND